MSKLIPLTKGQFTIVDDADSDRLSQFNWTSFRGLYAVRYESRTLHNGHQIRRTMQNEILGLPNNILVDHIDGNGLDNRRINLRPCTVQQNAWNTKKPCHGRSSRFKGVYLHKASGLYWAYISVNGKHKSLGYYKDETMAARARDTAAKHYHGEFARLNFPEE